MFFNSNFDLYFNKVPREEMVEIAFRVEWKFSALSRKPNFDSSGESSNFLYCVVKKDFMEWMEHTFS